MTSSGTFPIGRYLPGENTGLRVLCDDPDLAPHVDRPWFRAYVAERMGQKRFKESASVPQGNASIDGSDLARHACVCGASGSGKTRLALHLLAEQLRAGCSVVMLDPKAQTIQHMFQLALAAGVLPEDVTLLRPDTLNAGAPGWNPLAGSGGVPPEQAAADIVSVLARSAPSSWGPRLQDLLTNALIVIAAHRLSLFELARFLQRDDYRDGLLQQMPTRGVLADPEAYAEAAHFFTREFSRWSPSERLSASGPVINKFREMLRSPFLRAVLCARRTTLDLAQLWQRRSLVLVHLDTAGLGDEGARLLGGLMAHQLYQTSLRASGPIPVALCLDEMGIAEGFIGDAASKILGMARSQNLRLLVACQHLAQLSDGLRAAILANTAVRAFFRLGYDDARLVASWLAAGTGERLEAIRAEAPPQKREETMRDWTSHAHVICDGYGVPLELTGPAWTAFSGFRQGVGGDRQLIALGQLSTVSGVGRLYVRAPDTGASVELNRYVKGLDGEDYEVIGPSPVKLVIHFLRPRLSVTGRETEAERGQGWLRTLMELPVQHAVLRGASGQTGIAKIAAVSDPVMSARFYEFQARVVRSGQSASEVEATLEWRKREIERLASLAAPAPVPSGGTKRNEPSRSEPNPKVTRPAPLTKTMDTPRATSNTKKIPVPSARNNVLPHGKFEDTSQKAVPKLKDGNGIEGNGIGEDGSLA